MKPGDLVKIKHDCDKLPFGIGCHCFFCSHNSNRIGLVLTRVGGIADDGGISDELWTVLFDAGEWDVAEYEIEVLNESR